MLVNTIEKVWTYSYIVVDSQMKLEEEGHPDAAHLREVKPEYELLVHMELMSAALWTRLPDDEREWLITSFVDPFCVRGGSLPLLNRTFQARVHSHIEATVRNGSEESRVAWSARRSLHREWDDRWSEG